MAPVLMLNTVEVTIKASRSGEERRNVIHYRYLTGSPTLAQLNSLLAEVEGSIIDRYEDLVAIGTTFYELVAQDMSVVNGLTAARQITRVSTGVGDVMPGQVSHCLTKRTAQGGRSFRGRFFMFDLPEAYFNGDDMNPLYIPAVTDLCTRLAQSRVAGYFLAAVGSRHFSGSTPITSMTFDLVADTQRRRGKGRGI